MYLTIYIILKNVYGILILKTHDVNE